jgi:hypothetical protein
VVTTSNPASAGSHFFCVLAGSQACTVVCGEPLRDVLRVKVNAGHMTSPVVYLGTLIPLTCYHTHIAGHTATSSCELAAGWQLLLRWLCATTLALATTRLNSGPAQESYLNRRTAATTSCQGQQQQQQQPTTQSLLILRAPPAASHGPTQAPGSWRRWRHWQPQQADQCRGSGSRHSSTAP